MTILSDETPVRRCICHDISFMELKDAGVASVEEIAERFGAGTGCTTCLPYLRRMLETGETAFPILER